jgi:hypothetical protein
MDRRTAFAGWQWECLEIADAVQRAVWGDFDLAAGIDLSTRGDHVAVVKELRQCERVVVG